MSNFKSRVLVRIWRNSDPRHFIKSVEKIKNHWLRIVNFTNSSISDRILLGKDSKVQFAKRRAGVFRNIENSIDMIYFIAGKLKCSYSLYSKLSQSLSCS